MEECVKQALAVCPAEVRRAVEQSSFRQPLEEVRMRAGSELSVVCGGREWTLSEDGRAVKITQETLRELVANATEHSLYAAQDRIREGYCTLPGGHRLGVCGSVVRHGGEIYTIKEFSSANLRIARQVRGMADALSREVWQRPESTLIVGPPGCGKTTLLRDLIRQLSDRYRFRVSVIDERGELAACLDGVPQFQLGSRTDVLSYCTKAEGVFLLLRSMRPEWIAVDEISDRRDVETLCMASYCGVRFLATAHAWSREDLLKRPVYRALLDSGVFQNLALMDRDRQVRCERMPNE